MTGNVTVNESSSFVSIKTNNGKTFPQDSKT